MSYQKIKQNRIREVKELIDLSTNKVSADLVDLRNCPVCSSSVHTRSFTKEGFDFVKCSDCGMLYTPQVLKQKVLKKFYEDEYYTQTWKFKSRYKDSLDYKKKYFSMIAKKIMKFKKKGTCLDIGCGTGDFLNVMKTKGWQCFGTELNSYARNFVKENYGVLVYDKELNKFHTGEYDLISMSQLIEHIPDPKKALLHAHRVLKNKGLLFLAFPNEKGISILLKGKKADKFKGVEHINFFSKKTILKLLKNTGFELIYINSKKIDLYGILIFFFRKRNIYQKRKKTFLNKEKPFVNKRMINIRTIFSACFYKVLTPFCSTLASLFGVGEDLVVIARKR